MIFWSRRLVLVTNAFLSIEYRFLCDITHCLTIGLSVASTYVQPTPKMVILPRVLLVAGSFPPKSSPKVSFLSNSRKSGISAASKWIDNYLGHKCGLDLYKTNINYANSLQELTYESIEQDNVIKFLEDYGLWFAGNTLPAGNKKDSTLEASTKFTYFKAMKQVLLRQFPHHPCLKSSEGGWWHELIGSFSKLVFRTTMLDSAVPNNPPALPLYRDITIQDIGIEHGQSPDYANSLLRAVMVCSGTLSVWQKRRIGKGGHSEKNENCVNGVWSERGSSTSLLSVLSLFWTSKMTVFCRCYDRRKAWCDRENITYD